MRFNREEKLVWSLMSKLIDLFNRLNNESNHPQLNYEMMHSICENFWGEFFKLTGTYEHKCPPDELGNYVIDNYSNLITNKDIDTIIRWSELFKQNISDKSTRDFSLSNFRNDQYINHEPYNNGYGGPPYYEDAERIEFYNCRGLFGENINKISQSYKILIVSPQSDFANNLLNDQPLEEDVAEVPFVIFPSWLSIIHVIRSVIVTYSIMFGSFSRISICKYLKCNNLVLAKRNGQKHFCNRYCRRKNHTTNEDINKIKCRDRQNKFLVNRVDGWDGKYKGWRIGKNDCNKCNDKNKTGGECSLLIQRNSGALEDIFGPNYKVGSGR